MSLAVGGWKRRTCSTPSRWQSWKSGFVEDEKSVDPNSLCLLCSNFLSSQPSFLATIPAVGWNRGRGALTASQLCHAFPAIAAILDLQVREESSYVSPFRVVGRRRVDNGSRRGRLRPGQEGRHRQWRADSGESRPTV